MGQYSVYIADSNGCSIVENYIIYSPLTALQASSEQLDTICYNSASGYIQVSPSGGTPPYNYLWSNGQTDDIILNLSAGIYGVTISDSNNCLFEISDTISEFDSLNIIFNLSADTNGIGGSIYSTFTSQTQLIFSWNTGSMNSYLDSIPAGTYFLTITDSHDCIHNYAFNIPFIFLNQSSAIEGDTESNLVKIYPIPTSSQLIIEFEEIPFSYLKIKDLNGKLLSSSIFIKEKTLKINVEDFPVGAYIISIDQKNKSVNKLFIKK